MTDVERDPIIEHIAHEARRPVVVDPDSIRANYEQGFLEIRLTKQPPPPVTRASGAQSVRVT